MSRKAVCLSLLLVVFILNMVSSWYMDRQTYFFTCTFSYCWVGRDGNCRIGWGREKGGTEKELEKREGIGEERKEGRGSRTGSDAGFGVG